MSTKELKKRLIDKIRETEDTNLLQEAYRLLDIEFTDVDIYKLSTAQKKAIEEAKAQIEKGDFLTDEEANAEIEQWLKR